jgi:D-psicose/D-tagatose/L-ribulose 3-epimerase
MERAVEMKYGIYYAYWEKEWGGDFIPYIEKVKNLGFDILEVSCAGFDKQPEAYFHALRTAAEKHGIMLTGNYGPIPGHNIASLDPAVVTSAFRFYEDVFKKMDIAGIRSIGGALYSYWPVDYSQDPDKAGDKARSIAGMKKLADMAAKLDITLNMEVLNRFEGYMMNEAAEAKTYVQAVNKPNVKVLLDTFHMNIEEESITGAIRTIGKDLGHMHVGEMNRKPPQEGRMPWREIAGALREIGFDGNVVMEPFTQMGGQVGRDIKVWRDISGGATQEEMDAAVAKSVRFLRSLFER